MRSRPPLVLGLISGAIIGVALFAIHLILVRTIQQQDIGMNLFMTGVLLLITLPLLGLWLYSLIELVTIRYAVDRNGLTISTLFLRRTIPHGEIREIMMGAEAESDHRFRGISWPGFMRGNSQSPAEVPLWVLSTEPLGRQLIVVTDTIRYGISPSNVTGFLQGYERHRDLGALEIIPHIAKARAIAAWPVWRDRAFWLAMAVGLVANLALVAWAVWRYARLPAIVPMHWDAAGHIDRLAPKAWVFSIPAIGMVILGLNLIVGLLLSFREQFGSRLLAWAAVAVQAGLWLAALEIMAL